MESLPTFLPFSGAFIGAMIGATIFSLVQWQIDKKRQKFAYRCKLVTHWRKIFDEISKDYNHKWTEKDVVRALSVYGYYSSFLAHMNPLRPNDPRIAHAVDMTEKFGLCPWLWFFICEVQFLEKVVWKLA